MDKTPTVYRLGWGQKELTREDAEGFAGVGLGWRETIIKALLDHIDFFYEEFHISQIKEKFGGLRFYVSGGTFRDGMEHYVGHNDTNAYINFAEHLSFYVCEECGRPGSLRGGGWLVTLCDECDEKRGKDETE